MHLVVMRHGKAVMFDTSTTGRSLMRLPVGGCRPDTRSRRPGAMDCWAHAVEFDYNTGALRSLKIVTDTWCSSGAFDVDGNLVQTGGYFEGDKSVRYLGACDRCDWKEFPKSLAEGRWYSTLDLTFSLAEGSSRYATQLVLPDGGFIVIGGRRAFSYEFVPPGGQVNTKTMPLRLLRETTDEDENNLYPFVYLLPDGNLFIFVNDRSVVFDYGSGQVVRELPILPAGARNYPASAMSALLPLDLRRGVGLSAEVIVCGGATKNSFKLGESSTFPPALRDCARINPSKPRARWALDQMPVARVMGDMLILPTGDLLMLNGAAKGCSGWGFGRQPVLSPVLYSPHQPRGKRFRALTATTVPRMFTLRFATPAQAVGNADVKVTMYAPPFTTHGYSMNQRLLILPVAAFAAQGRQHTVTVDPPPKPELAPPGYYMVYVVAKGVPSKAAWVKIHK
uniref:Glyoxal oxidase N-terminal domain-containing protein n=1 Tax=Oryza brachyantha TaxID=4533 RepID=J3L2U8_ORYBR